MTSSHDYVIVGAGSAGCVLANRLSAGGARVLLLESGGSDRNLAVKAPAAFPTLFQGPRDWNYMSEPEPGLHGRRWYLPRGRMLGGSSSMNACSTCAATAPTTTPGLGLRGDRLGL